MNGKEMINEALDRAVTKHGPRSDARQIMEQFADVADEEMDRRVKLGIRAVTEAIGKSLKLSALKPEVLAKIVEEAEEPDGNS